MACGRQFRTQNQLDKTELWSFYLQNKQTAEQLSVKYNTSKSTIYRMLKTITVKWEQPHISGAGFVLIDATYWGRNWGVIVAIDYETGDVLYLEFVKRETHQDFKNAVSSIESRGYKIRGIICDGKIKMLKSYHNIPLQMCQFHMKTIIRGYLTMNPRLIASRELKAITDTLTTTNEETFRSSFEQWKVKWEDVLNKRTILKTGKSRYTHRKLRSAVKSIHNFLPYLFTYQHVEMEGMPNTNNKIEGIFSDLKKKLGVHNGMSKENRKRFICGFFLASKNKHNKKAEPR